MTAGNRFYFLTLFRQQIRQPSKSDRSARPLPAKAEIKSSARPRHHKRFGSPGETTRIIFSRSAFLDKRQRGAEISARAVLPAIRSGAHDGLLDNRKARIFSSLGIGV